MTYIVLAIIILIFLAGVSGQLAKDKREPK